MLKKILNSIKSESKITDNGFFNAEKNEYTLFAVFSSFWIFLGWIAFAMTLGGFFSAWIPLGFFLILFGFFLRQIFLKRISFEISKEFLFVFFAILAFVAISSFFVAPTIFSGRDQGSISEAAIRLAQNHKLEFSTPASQEFFKIYGSGKALNFPGFYYDQQGFLVTQFPLPYISWLAVFFSFFGLSGLIFANSVLFFIFLGSFYLLSRFFLKTKNALFLLFLSMTFFPFFWFFKFTLSENMAIALFCLSLVWIVAFIKNVRSFFFFSFLISSGLLIFTRIEGIFLFISGILVMFFLTRKSGFWKEKRKEKFIYPGIFLIAIFLVNFTKNFFFYKEMARAAFNFQNQENGTVSLFQEMLSPFIFQTKIFFLYGIITFILLGIFAIAYFWKKRNWIYLIPFFVALPSFLYLFNPQISSDHPWMLRRFVFSIFPVFLLYSIVFLEKWGEKEKFKKIISSFVLVSMASLNLFFFAIYFPFQENKNLLEETKKISENFSEKELVLVEREASGDGWSMITGPMSFIFGKNTVYFFNPDDLKKIDRTKFSKVYLVLSSKNSKIYFDSLGKENLKLIEEYSIKTKRLGKTSRSEKYSLPQKEETKIKGGIFELK